MQPRQKLLAVVFGLFALGMGGRWAWNSYVTEPLESAENLQAAAFGKMKSAQKKLDQMKREASQVDRLAPYALAGSPRLAQQDYQTFLIELLRKAGISQVTLTPVPASTVEGVTFIPFTLQGEAEMRKFVAFLREFYDAPRLQQIRRLSLNPIERKGMASAVRFSLTLEALALPPSDQKGKNEPTKGPAKDLADWKPKLVAERSTYEKLPSRSVLLAKGPGMRPLAGNAPEHVLLTSLFQKGSTREADLYDQVLDTNRRVRAGDSIDIGSTRGTILDLGRRDLLFESDGQIWQWRLGEPFSSRTPLTAPAALDRELAEQSARLP